MKLLFSRFIILAGAWMILGSARPAKQTIYQWYWADMDTYFEQASTATAINDFESFTGKLVNTIPTGGTLIGNAYQNTHEPHDTWPAVQLYSH